MSIEQLVPAKETIDLVGQLRGHGGWVTSIATSPNNRNVVLSGSRDRSVIVWDISEANRDEYGFAKKRLVGHDHYVQDVAISRDGQFALTGSWDASLRLWELQRGVSTVRFVGHKKDVLSVSFSADNRRIVSGSRDKTIMLWNTLGELKYTISDESHSEWVSCVRFSPSLDHPYIISAGWDKLIKVWDVATCRLTSTFYGHQGYINTLTTAPDGSLCASGGQDGKAMLWDLHDRKFVSSLDCGDIIHALSFSPNRFWLVSATASAVIVWDLESKVVAHELVLPEFKDQGKRAIPIQAISVAWSADGNTLYVGYTDNLIRVWKISAASNE